MSAMQIQKHKDSTQVTGGYYLAKTGINLNVGD